MSSPAPAWAPIFRWAPIIETLTKKQRFVISSHLNPDCDALGSELALAYLLLQQDKDVAIINADPIIADYQFLDPDQLIQLYTDSAISTIAQADVIIVLDASGGWHRLGIVGQAFNRAKMNAVSICIDHHPNEDPFTDLAFIDTNVIATGELIFDLITEMQGHLTPIMAQALYAAILTDSGSFRFPKTSPHTHRVIASLVDAGANPSLIYNLLYQQQSLSKIQLKGYVLQNIQLAADGQVAYVSLDFATLSRYGIDPLDLNAFSNLAEEIKGVRIAIFAVELADRRIKLSLRSDGSVAVNTLAAQFGGGGHAPAAGATVTGSLPQVLNQIVAKAGRLVLK